MLIQQQKSNGEDRQQQRLGGNEVAERRFPPGLRGTRFGTCGDREQLSSRLVHLLPLFLFFFFSFFSSSVCFGSEKKLRQTGGYDSSASFSKSGAGVWKLRMDDKRMKLHFGNVWRHF